jgi:hypothetical protein
LFVNDPDPAILKFIAQDNFPNRRVKDQKGLVLIVLGQELGD